MEYSFEIYLINVGIRSKEYAYDDEDIFNNIDYFRECYNRNMSAYKALLFLYDHLLEIKERDDKINSIINK